jgi:DNA adenine methylase
MNRLRAWLKWPGSKYPILDHLKTVLPTRTRFIDVFAGGGSVLLNMRGPCWANDANRDLILAWTSLQQQGVSFIDDCRELYTATIDTPDAYYILRREFNTTNNQQRRAVLFVHLNRHCFNGLCRYNKHGEFNAAYGHGREKHFPEEEMLACLPRLVECTFTAQDFRSVLSEARDGDVAYCDPPYLPASIYSDFDRYHPGHFSIDDHRALAVHVREAVSRGAHVVLSNADVALTREIYSDANCMEPVRVSRHISGKAIGRKSANELLCVFSTSNWNSFFS